ncbi:pilus assembly protein TadG-related protein [Bordetella flabilis]|uniref:Putative Flp pilus-assembly TadG-like N-terminal domain-containing protein n=1 Tax=Bordetella flabilis TaxID=463014 RepID=A0A193GEU2_9BORD|nr:pilus assembly protein TadG-related protein [Bordetella flabilis]ANN78572.1 hypothetical protein BAU07_16940 [Bordetella flabilis]
MTPRQRTRGQALPLALGLAALGALSLVVLYNLGQTIAARTRLTHTADAAAYSGALVQARALNLLAYINRAQIAHQVAMAHLVTLATWTQFGQAERQRLLRGNPPAALIAMLFGPVHGQAYASAAAGIDGAALVDEFERAYASHDAHVHQVLAAATRATIADLPASRQRAMQAVVRANYPEFQAPGNGHDRHDGEGQRDRLSMRVLADEWPGFVQRYAGNGRGGFRAMILGATERYGFLAPRNGIARNAWPVSFRCPERRHELRRRGATTLGRDGTWRSVDTQSFHKLRSNKYIGCYYREYAMGWGKADGRFDRRGGDGDAVAMDAPADFSRQDFWRWVRQHTSWDIVNGVSNPLAYAYAVQAATRWRGGGQPAYAEVSQVRRAARFVLRLAQPAPLLATTDAGSTIASPQGRLAYAGLRREDQVSVTSAAETYFVRPVARQDGSVELATLFRPYWQARLAPRRRGLTGTEPRHAP